MSKLSASLKSLIHAPFARPGPTPAGPHIADVYRSIAADAVQHGVGSQPWLTFLAATTITLNAPEALTVLYQVATDKSTPPPPPPLAPVATAELIREVGLKCIGFNGIPRTINALGSFRANSIPSAVAAQLATKPTRVPAADTLAETTARGLGLWRSIYAGVDVKLLDKLAESHPDLPVHILHSHYGPLFSDPPNHAAGGLATVGRALTSLVAIACLRAQTGVGPQLVSHVLGLRKAVADGTWLPAGADATEADNNSVLGVKWLATDVGTEWLLQSIDRVVAALGGANFATTSAGEPARSTAKL
ncbi:hypothetical protein SEPCBS119000_005105 [Sporothrix epigloea]|uniref:Mitochondrial protein n=1 Tax=Sporothrix epigloea TaxID=1892477 RepID=A0ABP0DVS7_9PEZI